MISLNARFPLSAVVVLTAVSVVSPIAAAQSSGENLVVRDPLTEQQIKDEYERLSKNQGKLKAVALPFDAGGIPLADVVKAGLLMGNEVETRIRSGGVEFMSASFRERLSPIIVRCEQVGEDPECVNLLSEVGSNAADIMAISGKIDLAQVRSEHKPGKPNEPGSCVYSGEVKATVTVHHVSSWTQIRDLPLTGISKRERRAVEPIKAEPNTVAAPPGPPCPTNGIEAEMVEEAIRNAGMANESELKNLFGAIGLVFGVHRDGQGKVYFQTTLPANGLDDVPVKLFARGEATHPMTKKTQRTTVPIGEGKIVRPMNSGNEAWIEVSQLEQGQEVKKGDMVQVAHKAALVENVADIHQGADKAEKTAEEVGKTLESAGKGVDVIKKIGGFFGFGK